MSKYFLDAGTTFSKIIELGSNKLSQEYAEYLIKKENDKNYYILPSAKIKQLNLTFDKATGHMTDGLIANKNDYENEIIALASGVKKLEIEDNAVVLDLGSRDSKWIKFKNNKFSDLDWNNSCASATGTTVEMLLKFYDVNLNDLKFTQEKYNITCGIFGLEKIMDEISKGISASNAISKFIHGIAFNSWNFTNKANKIYLSGGFCDNKCFTDSLSQYAEVVSLGRFILCEGLINN